MVFFFTSPRLRGEVGSRQRDPGEGSFSKRGGDDFEYACHIFQYFVIPETENAIVVIGKPFISDLVSRVVRMLATVGLDDETTLTAYEIDRIGPQRLLTNKLEPI